MRRGPSVSRSRGLSCRTGGYHGLRQRETPAVHCSNGRGRVQMNRTVHRARTRARKALLVLLGMAVAALASLAPAAADTPPYSMPVTLPGSVNAPSVDASAPYTPAVLSLIAQLEPS